MIDILCMILSVIKLFIYIMAFHFKSIKRTINLTKRKTERWTSRQLYILIKKGKKIIKLVHNHIMMSVSVSVQELDRFIVFWSVQRCLQKLTEKCFSMDHTGETLRTCSWSTLLSLSILRTRSNKKHGCAHKITQGKHKNIIFNMLLNRYAVAGCCTECLGCLHVNL